MLFRSEDELISTALDSAAEFKGFQQNLNAKDFHGVDVLVAAEELIDFEAATETGVQLGTIRSIIPPILADHVRREGLKFVDELKRAGYWIVGLDQGAKQTVFDLEFPELSALVVGSEGSGLRSLTRATCDHLVSIPMLGRVESLNVSVAAAVALYERVRQRSHAPGGKVSTD